MSAAQPPPPPPPPSSSSSTALVTKDDQGGILVIKGPRPCGDTSSGSVFVTDLPKSFMGGDESLHFALGELFGAYGKIKKIELYMEEGILETKDFKGEALVVFHKTKHTGTHDKGDPVYEACTDMDGKWRVLGKRNWRMRCEPAQWQRDGYNVKDKAKTFPCVELSNLWDYDSSLPLAHYSEMSEAIRAHAAEHIQAPFVKVEPSLGTATIWCKGAQDAWKFASIMHKSFFLGRKIVSTLCRKVKPATDSLPKVPIGELTMKRGNFLPKGLSGPEAAAPGQSIAQISIGAVGPVALGPSFLLGKGCKIEIKGLLSKPENNGLTAEIICFMPDEQKYKVELEDGRIVKLKVDNVGPITSEGDLKDARKRQKVEEEEVAPAMEVQEETEENEEAAEAEAAAAEAAAAAEKLASGSVRHGPEMPAPKPGELCIDGFTATVCVDPSLLPKRATAEESEPVKRRESSRSRERRQQERIDAIKARVEANKGSRPSWVVGASPEVLAAQAKAAVGATAPRSEPEESREDLIKLPVSKLKELLKEYGRPARGCIEKRDFVDRLKPPPKE